jgi:hypothetical protein
VSSILPHRGSGGAGWASGTYATVYMRNASSEPTLKLSVLMSSLPRSCTWHIHKSTVASFILSALAAPQWPNACSPISSGFVRIRRQDPEH